MIWTRDLEDAGYTPRHENDADELSEFAGRNCYRSFDRPNPKTRENKDYLAHILDVGHGSVLEHGTATFYIEASRSVLAEMTRHRHMSFSVVSQRYVDANDLGFHTPPLFRDDEYAQQMLDCAFADAMLHYNELVDHAESKGVSRKQAREAARAVLPNAIDSPMVVTANHRAWRYFIEARWHEAADAEIRELAGMILAELRSIAPNIYQDIPSEPYTY